MQHQKIITPSGSTVSFCRYGEGPPLVLIHGSFSNEVTNWEFVKPLLEKDFCVYAIARRGRGESSATEGHSLEDEGNDAAALIDSIGEPVFLLGHSYGAHCAMLAAARVPDQVRKLVLYEGPWPGIATSEALASLEAHASNNDWDGFSHAFFRDVLLVPQVDMDGLRASELWPPIVADARASLGDVRAVTRHDFQPERFRALRMPVLLQVGTESPRDLFVTDALAAVLPDVKIGELAGQAHEGMTTAPVMYAEAITRFFLTD